jgi:hypothetical protein
MKENETIESDELIHKIYLPDTNEEESVKDIFLLLFKF